VREPVGDEVGGAVARRVVDDDDLVRPPRLPVEALEGGGEQRARVERRDDDARLHYRCDDT
jgi:hypothetical protein